MKEKNHSKPEAELWEMPIFNGWAKKVEYREAYNTNVRKCEELYFIQLAS